MRRTETSIDKSSPGDGQTSVMLSVYHSSCILVFTQGFQNKDVMSRTLDAAPDGLCSFFFDNVASTSITWNFDSRFCANPTKQNTRASSKTGAEWRLIVT